MAAEEFKPFPEIPSSPKEALQKPEEKIKEASLRLHHSLELLEEKLKKMSSSMLLEEGVKKLQSLKEHLEESQKEGLSRPLSPQLVEDYMLALEHNLPVAEDLGQLFKEKGLDPKIIDLKKSSQENLRGMLEAKFNEDLEKSKQV